MADRVQRVPAAAISKLLNVPEIKLESLVKSGVIPKPASGGYELVNSVRGYIDHLRAESALMDQVAVARHLDMTDRNLREVLRSLGIDWPADPDEIRVAYIRDLREKAAGRGGESQEKLTLARIREADASSSLKELQIAERAGTLVPVSEVQPRLLSMITAARQELLTLPEKIAGDLKALHGIDVDTSLIMERIYDSLKHLASHQPTGDAPDDDASDARLVATTEADDN